MNKRSGGLNKDHFRTNLRLGFTLIELLVVVLIMGILSAAALPQYQTAVDKTRYSTLMDVVKAMKDGQELYYLANGNYSSDFSQLDIEMPLLNGSVSGRTVTYPNGQFFMLENDGGLGHEYVYGRDPKVNITYLLYLDHTTNAGKRFCWAYDNNDRANRVCRGMGGTNPVLNGGNAMVYELP